VRPLPLIKELVLSGAEGEIERDFPRVIARNPPRQTQCKLQRESRRNMTLDCRTEPDNDKNAGLLWMRGNGDDGEHASGRAVIPENTVGCRRILLGICLEHLFARRPL